MTLPWLLMGAGLAAALGHLVLSSRAESWPRSVIKTVPLALFALAAWVADAPPFLTAALVFSALGDLALSRPGQQAFLYGLASFALAHLVYILLFASLGAGPLGAFATAPLPAIALLVLALSTELWLAPHADSLRWPVRVYVVLITAMGLAALALPAAPLAAAGALLFLASDLILAIQLFRMARDHALHSAAGWALWTLYIAGQALILIGITPL